LAFWQDAVPGGSLLNEERGSSSSSNAISNSLNSVFFFLAGTSASSCGIGHGLHPTDRREYLATARVLPYRPKPPKLR
jgi:hypothetical protein